MDGTLIDSEPLICKTIADWCRKRGVSPTKEDENLLIGLSMAGRYLFLKSRYKLTESEEIFHKECAAAYKAQVNSSMIRKEPVTVLRKLAELGIPQAIVSNGDPDVVQSSLDTLAIGHLIDFIVTRSDVRLGKPSPDPYLLSAERAGFRPQECMAIEDSSIGVRSAAAAKMVVAAWPTEIFTIGTEFKQADYSILSSKTFPWELFSDYFFKKRRDGLRLQRHCRSYAIAAAK